MRDLYCIITSLLWKIIIQNMNIHIRHGKSSDLPKIHELVHTLAIYENEPNAVTATLEDYYRDYNDGLFKIIVAEIDADVKGMMLYYTAYSTWKGKMIHLEDFVIEKNYRKLGIGQQLMNFLLQLVKQDNAKLVKWQVLDWNTPAIKFYKKMTQSLKKTGGIVRFSHKYIKKKYNTEKSMKIICTLQNNYILLPHRNLNLRK